MYNLREFLRNSIRLPVIIGMILLASVSIGPDAHPTALRANPDDEMQFTVEHTGELLSRYATLNFETPMTREDRRRLVREILSDRNKADHVMLMLQLLSISIQFSDARASESAEAAAMLQPLWSRMDMPEGWHGLLARVGAFVVEDPERGFATEVQWFEEMRTSGRQQTLELLYALAFTRWPDDPEKRFEMLLCLYRNPEVSHDTREQIVEIVGHGLHVGTLDLTAGCVFYRDLARLPETSPALTSLMFDKVSIAAMRIQLLDVQSK